MNYSELIAKAIKGRKIAAVAKEWGVNQMTLGRYVSGERLPDFDTALKIANEAGVAPGDAFETLAAEQRMHKSRQFRLQSGFVQTTYPLIVAGATVLCCCFYIM